MGRLIDTMFDVSMLDLHPLAHDGRSAEVGEAIAAAVNVATPLAEARNMTIVAAERPRVAVALEADRLTQVLINLLENAVKHGRAGGTIAVSATAADARTIEICVDDDGPGVPPAERELVFTLTGRGTNASARGSGIGLAVVRMVVERASGEIDVLDSPLGGAQFRMRLPFAKPSATAMSALVQSRRSHCSSSQVK